MQQFHHILYFLSVLFLISGPVQAFVLPDSSEHGSTPVSQQQSVQRAKYTIFPQLTWIRDTLIEKVIGPRLKSGKLVSSKPSSVSRPSSSELPANLLAKYGGDVVLRFNLSTPAEEKALAEVADTLYLDIWDFTNNWADIRLREDDIPSVLSLLPNSLKTAYSNLMPNLAKTISNTYPSIAIPAPPPRRADGSFTPALKASDGVDDIFFRDYQPYSVLIPWMRLMASMFNTHVKMINIGISYEGRDIPALKVGVSPKLSEENVRRKTILVTGGFHAREWISVSTVTFMAWSLISSYGKSPGITKLLQEFDFVFVPTANPDGYVYTWESDRLWRKNRQQTSLRFCTGLDLDHGFGYEWDGKSAQTNPCSESFPGDEPFQAVESHRLAEWARNETENNSVNFVGFLDLHSYSQQVLYPYSFSCRKDPPSLENLEELAMGLAKAIRISSGEQYSVASACEGAVPYNSKDGSETARMETGGGSAIDWFYHEMKVRYSYQIKLRDTGSYGFLLPSDNIIPTGEEAFNALKYFGDFLLGNKGIESNLFEELHQPFAGPDTQEPNEEPEDENEAEVGEVDYEVDDVNWELRRRRR